MKTEQRTKMMALDEWLKAARADVEKQKTQKLLKEYNAEFAQKKETIAAVCGGDDITEDVQKVIK